MSVETSDSTLVLSYDNAKDESSDLGGGKKSGVSVPAPVILNLGTGGRGGLFYLLDALFIYIFFFLFKK